MLRRPCREVRAGNWHQRLEERRSTMTTEPTPQVTNRPGQQLPRGRFPATPTAIWTLAALVVVTGAVLGVGIPLALSAPATDPGGSEIWGGPEGGQR